MFKSKKAFIKLVIVISIIALITLYYLSQKIILQDKDITIGGTYFLPHQWSGTITITKDTLFLPWTTLYIEPGTTILFEKIPDENINKNTNENKVTKEIPWSNSADDFIKNHNDPTGKENYATTHFDLTAKIIAHGTTQQPILFTSAQKQPEYADWDELVLYKDSILENIELSYAHNGINLQNDIEGGNIIIRQSHIHHSLWSCIDIFSAGNLIEHNEIDHCWHQAIGIKTQSNNFIKNNNIHDAQLSLNCEFNAKPMFEKNTFISAPLNPDCGPVAENTQKDQKTKSIGGTYNGEVIYPANENS